MDRRILVAASLLAAGCRTQELTGLVRAARAGNINRIHAWLAAGADPNAPSGVYCWTPVMHAIHKNQLESVRALLDGGADVNARTARGDTALIMAAGYGNTPMVKLLLRRGADPRARNWLGLRALDAAIAGVPDIDEFTLGACQTETVRALVAAAPDLRPSGTLPGQAGLALARLSGCSEVLRLLNDTTFRLAR